MINEDRSGAPDRTKRLRLSWKGWVSAGAFLIMLFSPGFLWLRGNKPVPRSAPEAERVLAAQADLPFQVLIPGYLPGGFNRGSVDIRIDQPGPRGEAMIQLTYLARPGISLILREWLLDNQGSADIAENGRKCVCICRSSGQCDMVGVQVTVGRVRVRVDFSVPGVLSPDQMQFVLDTLGPAANRQIYSSMNEVPLTYSVPPAVDVPLNASGVQELTLVVSPQGYSPAHFAVKVGVPVRLTFRQLGEVSCGNELILQWGQGHSATLLLASPSDAQVLEFTPGQPGDFRFNCPHLIYRGVMTVRN